MDTGFDGGNPIKQEIVGSKPKMLSKKDKDSLNFLDDRQDPSESTDNSKPFSIKSNVRPKRDEEAGVRDQQPDILRPFGGTKINNPIRGMRKTPDNVGNSPEENYGQIQNDSNNFETTPKPKGSQMNTKMDNSSGKQRSDGK